MIPRPDAQQEILPVPVLDRIDRACLRFEAAWKRDETPWLEDFLGDSEGDERSRLLAELLVLEFDYRRRKSHSAFPGEYYFRFPGDENVIEAAFTSRELSVPQTIGPADYRQVPDCERVEQGWAGVGVSSR